uniref:Pif-1 per os infectivity factor 1 n=1 Tax=Spodoptera littoralis nuclear polyhedrosis virus TaxID=10456 RepID=A0A3G4S928_NPVSL|nr:pif-1 per os infectivity factor 1 [Spodoptera littoralis nucleopolyhedrovirus]
MYKILLIVLFLVVVLILVRYVGQLYRVEDEKADRDVVRLFDNSHVPYISPPTSIIVEGNTHECHKQLTPCSTHRDCDLCREAMANCQYFDEPVTLRLQDQFGETVEYKIEPGESYCMALDRQRARRCNPNTGVWLLTESDVGFSLICSCTAPGLVTQVNMYEDCDVPVGCLPHGVVADINEKPIRCKCNSGFVSDFLPNTEIPYCRSQTFRDVLNDTNFVPVAPCPPNYIQVDHPGLPNSYAQYLRNRNACVPNPCAIDPITGERHNGIIMYDDDNTWCGCTSIIGIFPVYSSGGSMLRPSNKTLVNSCIKPFTSYQPQFLYKVFWARNEEDTADADIVANVSPDEVNPEYRVMLFPMLLGGHDTLYDENWSMNKFIFKFSVSYTPRTVTPGFEHIINQLTDHAIAYNVRQKERPLSSVCFRRPAYSSCTLTFPHITCILLGSESRFERTCFGVRDTDEIIKMATTAVRYAEYFILTLVVSGNFLQSVRPNDNILNTVFGIITLAEEEHGILRQLLDTYPNYSVR